VRDEGDRNTSLAASIAYSFTHLPAQDQQAITVLSLFHTITDSNVLDLLSQSPRCPPRLQGLSSQQWSEMLQRAAGLGLLSELGGGMFRLHPALPSYLTAHWKRLDPDGFTDEHSAAIRALLDSYASLAFWLSEQWNNENARFAVTVTDLHRRNLSAMLGHALNHQQWTHAHPISEVLDDFWDLRGLYEEARGWVDRVQHILEDPPGTPPRLDTPAGALWAFLTQSQANRHLTAGQVTQAEDTYRTLLDALQQVPDTDHTRANIAGLYHQLGVTAEQQGDLNQAESRYRQALAISEVLRDRPSMARSYHQLGITAQLRGDLSQAEHWYRKSLGIEEQLRDRPGMARCYHQLGIITQLRGDLGQAERWTRQSLAISEQLDDRPGTAAGYHQLGRIAQKHGDLGRAEDWYRKSLTISEELRDRPNMASTYHQLGITAQDQGDLDQAEHWYHQSLGIREKLRDRAGIARGYHQLGIIFQLREDLDQAESRYRQALTIWEELHSRPGLAPTYGQIGLLAEQRGDLREALRWTIRAIALFDEYPHPATGPGPHQLERLTRRLGVDVLHSLWQTTTGQPLPPAVHAAVTAGESANGTEESPGAVSEA
ncbi:tetratricopeptide repeat protein, partial [Actinomadura sp. DSM 109109]|nr:tetratricopeptide repeat protein [Actinomadura lepetitiana]